MYVEFEYACVKNNVETVRKMINEGFDPSFNKNKAFIQACVHDSFETVKLLMDDERIDIDTYGSLGRRVCQCGRVKIMKLLLADKRTKISSYWLNDAVGSGSIELVKLLLDDGRFNIMIVAPMIIYNCKIEGDVEMIKFLLGRNVIDFKTWNNALRHNVKKSTRKEINNIISKYLNSVIDKYVLIKLASRWDKNRETNNYFQILPKEIVDEILVIFLS